MGSSIYFDCPFCSYGKDVPKKYYGKKIKCPRCLATLTLGVPQPTDLTALPLPADGGESPVDQTAIEIETSEILLECPSCFKIVETDDSLCPHCGKTLKKECPFCSALIDAASVFCTNCKRGLLEKMEDAVDETTEETVREKNVAENKAIELPKEGMRIFHMGIASLICGLGIIFGPIAIFSGLAKRSAGLSKADRELIYGGIAMGTAGTLGSILLLGSLIIKFVAG